MGLGIGFSKCTCPPATTTIRVEVTNTPPPLPLGPNPLLFTILRIRKIGDFSLVEAQYDGCTNYEGRKILVLEGFYAGDSTLDPHFCEGPHRSPIARFEPTERGWDMGVRFCEAMGR